MITTSDEFERYDEYSSIMEDKLFFDIDYSPDGYKEVFIDWFLLPKNSKQSYKEISIFYKVEDYLNAGVRKTVKSDEVNSLGILRQRCEMVLNEKEDTREILDCLVLEVKCFYEEKNGQWNLRDAYVNDWLGYKVYVTPGSEKDALHYLRLEFAEFLD